MGESSQGRRPGWVYTLLPCLPVPVQPFTWKVYSTALGWLLGLGQQQNHLLPLVCSLQICSAPWELEASESQQGASDAGETGHLSPWPTLSSLHLIGHRNTLCPVLPGRSGSPGCSKLPCSSVILPYVSLIPTLISR